MMDCGDYDQDMLRTICLLLIQEFLENLGLKLTSYMFSKESGITRQRDVGFTIARKFIEKYSSADPMRPPIITTFYYIEEVNHKLLVDKYQKREILRRYEKILQMQQEEQELQQELEQEVEVEDESELDQGFIFPEDQNCRPARRRLRHPSDPRAVPQNLAEYRRWRSQQLAHNIYFHRKNKGRPESIWKHINVPERIVEESPNHYANIMEVYETDESFLSSSGSGDTEGSIRYNQECLSTSV